MPPRMEPMTRSIRHVVQCAGHTKTGARCRRRTGKTQYCYFHLEKEEHVKVKPSGIGGAGMGLYTTIRRPAHRKIVEYRGDTISRPENTYRGDYVLETTGAHPPPYTYVDANKTSAGSGRFANMARAGDGRRNNSKLSMDRQRHKANIVSGDHAIPAGREILTSYGRLYWNHPVGN